MSGFEMFLLVKVFAVSQFDTLNLFKFHYTSAPKKPCGNIICFYYFSLDPIFINF